MRLGWPNAEMTTASCAVLVGVAALFVALDQSNIARQQAELMERTVQASVWPVVQFDFESDQDLFGATATLTLRNSGVGPALIKGVRLVKEGIEVQDADALFADRLDHITGMRFDLDTRRGSGRVLAAGDSVAIADATWELPVGQIPSGLRDRIEVYFDSLAAVEGEVCYCSALEECWIGRTSDYADPEPVEVCDPESFGGF